MAGLVAVREAGETTKGAYRGVVIETILSMMYHMTVQMTSRMIRGVIPRAG
jgi:hypothetical protein